MLPPIPWPICGLCNKPVDEVFSTPQFNYQGGIEFTIRCHGAEETGTLSESDLRSALSITLVPFRQPSNSERARVT